LAGKVSLALLLAAVTLLLPRASSAHEIPNDVTVQAFLKPAGQRLHLIVRAPLKAMRDVNFPQRGVGEPAGQQSNSASNRAVGSTRGVGGPARQQSNSASNRAVGSTLKEGEGFLDLARVDSSLREAATLWISGALELYEGDRRLPKPVLVDARVGLESDRFFESYEQAVAHVTGPRLPDSTVLYWSQGMLDVLFEYPIQSDRSELSIRPAWARLGVRVLTVLRFLPPDGGVRVFQFHGDPDLVRLDPRWHQAAGQFVKLGFFHILDGFDHLLFLFCLVIPLRNFRTLFLVITSFTVAHSVTLVASAYNLAPAALWWPPLVETLIASSIVYMALENIAGVKADWRWIITFCFGLIHGFGFSFMLRETLQFAGSHLLTSLVSFNLGVELGQVLVLALLIPLLHLLFRFVVAERIGTIILSAIVAHTGWHWLTDRAATLMQYQFQWPALDAVFLAGLIRWLMLILICVVLAWLVSAIFRLSHRARPI
jgi:hypothetical protein